LNRGLIILIGIVIAALVLANMPVASARLLVYILIGMGAVWLISHWMADARERRAPPVAKPKPPTEAQKRWQEFRDEVEALSLEQARGRVDAIMRKGDIWEPGEPPVDGPIELSKMPPSAESLFVSYGPLKSKFGDAKLGGVDIERFVWPGADVLGFGESGVQKGVVYLKIGVDFDGNPMVTKPGQETVFVVHRPESNPAKWWSADYPSINHWILMQSFDEAA
jgi:uncharacterized membrane protein YuzA (DUF378 family)